jgi:regulator of sigma D
MNETPVAGKHLEHAIAELLQERGQLLSLFCELAGSERSAVEVRLRLLQRFCQLLIDYASLWQFEVRVLLLETSGEREAVKSALIRHQPAIDTACEVALAFNDRYDSSAHTLDLSRLDRHLSRLGEALAARFDAEDRVVSTV